MGRMHADERPNYRLRKALELSGVTLHQLADEVGILVTGLSTEIKYKIDAKREDYLVDTVMRLNDRRQEELHEVVEG